MRRLVLFDIDGTLLTDRGASREAFAAALEEVFGDQGDLSRYDFSGKTDPQIAQMVLEDAGWSHEAVAERLPELWERYLAGLAGNAAGDRVRVLPGVLPLLEELARHPEVVLALLTGNIEQGARLKLGAAGLNGYFPFGAFGSDSADRNALAPFAIQRASEHVGRRFSAADVVIIGDSIYDVRCGAPWQATTIAVASGRTSGELLRAENPDHFFESAEDSAALMRAILGH